MAITPRTVGRSVIITGAAGYIGSHITLAFLERGWSVTAVDDLSAGSRATVPAAAQFIEMDCADPKLHEVMAASGYDAAVHMAARISVDESVADPLGYYEANFSVARSFFASAASAGIKAIVFSSTAAVYGDTGKTPVLETHPCQPLSPYGRSKLAAEWALRDLSAVSDLRHVILRYFNVAGADPEGRAGPRAGAGHLMKLACEAAVGARSGMVIHGDDYATPDGTCIRDYIHVSDLALAHIAAVEHLLGGGESLIANCGYGSGFSVREVLDVARDVADLPFDVTIGPRRPGDPEAIVADARLLAERFGWRPAHSGLESILETGIAWERRRQTGTLPAR